MQSETNSQEQANSQKDQSASLGIIDDPHLVSLISSQVSDVLDKRLQDRESRMLKVLGAITALILFVGYQGIREMISSATKDATAAAIQRQGDDLLIPVTLATLATLIAKAEQNGSFSHSERDDMFIALERLAEARKRGINVAQHSWFNSTLERVIDAMANSGNDLFLDRAYDLFPDDCLKNSGIVQTMLQHYGRHAVGDVGAGQAQALKRFEDAERTAYTHKVPEYALAHRVLILHRLAGERRDAKTLEAMKHIDSLSGSDKQKAWEFLQEYAEHRFTRRRLPFTLAVQRTAVDFIEKYRPELRAAGFSEKLELAESGQN